MDERKENSIKYQKLNDEDDDVVKIKSPEDDASIFSLLTFSYSWFYFLNFSFVDFYIWKGLFTSPKAEDVPELSQDDKCEVQVKNFGKNWKNQPKEKKSLIKTLFETNILRIFESGMIFLTVVLIQVATPILLNQFFIFLSNSHEGKGVPAIGIGLAFSIFILSFLKLTLDCQYYL